MADIKQVGQWMNNLKPDEKIKRPNWGRCEFIYLHQFPDNRTEIGMCTSPGQVDYPPIVLHHMDIVADDWQLIKE